MCCLTGCGNSKTPKDETPPPPTPTTSVPDLRFLKAQETIDAIEAAGLTLGIVAGEYRLKMTTGSTIDQSLAPGTIVDEGTAINITQVATHIIRDDERLSQAWAGQWRMKTVYIKRGQHLVSWQDKTLCNGDPLGAGLAQAILPEIECTAFTTNELAELNCSAYLDITPCGVDTSLSFSLFNNDNGTIIGNGQWSANGTCQGTQTSDGESITIEGTRLGLDVSECNGLESSFLQKFVHPPLLQEPIF